MNTAGVESISIRPIDKGSIHQICSGQVVLNLATAVKELLENSLDAGATTIQIKLDEYGSEAIEVIDNGCGVEEANFQALTLKHHTSKISDFNDLYSVETFGFRGEALSSLCALSVVTIITKHKNAEIGATLKFNHQGVLVSSTKTLRKIGTTVKLENLFCTLPVRRVEFIKNLKREFLKMCNVVYAYGLQSIGVRITCVNHVSKVKALNKNNQDDTSKKGSSTIIMDTKGDSIESNIRSVFGIKQKQNLLKIIETLPSQSTLSEYGLENKKLDLDKFKISGFISSCAHGCGRTASDRQFYYVNSRPTDNPKISKLVNEVYHQFNNRQDPFVTLNIKIATGSFDVNVTPDKRQILIKSEKILLALLKESLISTFQCVPSTLEIQNVGLLKKYFDTEEKHDESFSEKFQKLKANIKLPTSKSQKINETDRRIENLIKFQIKPVSSQSSETRETGATPQRTFSSFRTIVDTSVTKNDCEVAVTTPQKSGEELNQCDNSRPIIHVDTPRPQRVENLSSFSKVESSEKQKTAISLTHQIQSAVKSSADHKRKLIGPSFQALGDEGVDETEPESGLEEIEVKRMRFDAGLSPNEKSKRTTVLLNVDFGSLKEMILAEKESVRYAEKDTDPEVRFRAEIKPQSNKKAEMELKKVMKKENFGEMEILGQFNLGFIITKLKSDIFIVDQHASDEKYNFETLQRTTVMQSQRLINSETLDLTADREELMVQHENVFKKNGFDFAFDETAVPTRRIQLTRIPFSKNIMFGKEDIDELLFLLEDAPEKTMLRPSRVESMFASRACRKSVMIGTPLNHNEMRKIVVHMGEIEQPWNCPHGRPTMRHLININMIGAGK